MREMPPESLILEHDLFRDPLRIAYQGRSGQAERGFELYFYPNDFAVS